jgi:hypothetical protein
VAPEYKGKLTLRFAKPQIRVRHYKLRTAFGKMSNSGAAPSGGCQTLSASLCDVPPSSFIQHFKNYPVLQFVTHPTTAKGISQYSVYYSW